MNKRAGRSSFVRKHLTTFAVAAVSVIATASILGLLPSPTDSAGNQALAAISNCPAPTVSNIPCIKYGFKDGPVPLNTTLTTIASLPVGAGKYVINAKLYVGNSNSGSASSNPLPTECQLVAGADFDWAKESIAPTLSQTQTFDLSATMSLIVSHTFTLAGSVDLKYDSPTSSGILQAHFIKITAQKVGTLIRVNMP